MWGHVSRSQHPRTLVRCAQFLARVSLLALLVAAGAASAPAQPCEPEWSSQFPAGTLDGIVHATCVYDEDGDGPNPPALFVAGAFQQAAGLTVNRIARWDGAGWSSLGVGCNRAVFALDVYDPDGNGPEQPVLVVAGSFTTAGGALANSIATWNGTSWSAVGGGVNSTVYTVCSWDEDGDGPDQPALFAGGLFTTASGVPVSHIARWDGTSWTPLDVGTDQYVAALAVHDPDGPGPELESLYVGGAFTSAGAVPADRIARWNSVGWSALVSGPSENGVNGIVEALEVWDPTGEGDSPRLYVGGQFTMAGSTVVNRIARWDEIASEWEPLGDGLDEKVWDLCALDPDGPGPEAARLLAAGAFMLAGDSPAARLAIWDGSEWAGFATGPDDTVRTVSSFDDAGQVPVPIYAGGDFTSTDGIAADGIARWGCPLTETAPVIASHPSSQLVCSGDPATFSVSAWGTEPLLYQWRLDGADIPGATGDTYTIGGVGPADVGVYDVVVTNDFGMVVSEPAQLDISVPPEIITPPQPQSVCLGETVTLSVTASGTAPLTYQWRRNFQLIFGATDPQYVIASVDYADVAFYDVIVTGTCGSVTSDFALLEVQGGPFITVEPQSQQVCVGAEAQFFVGADGGDDLAYQWYRDDVPIFGATSDTLIIPAAGPGDEGSYYAELTDTCGTTTTSAAELSVSSDPTITADPTSVTACLGAEIDLSVSVTGVPPLSYQWFLEDEPLAGATDAVLTLPALQSADAGEYHVEVTDACGSAASAPATVTVATGPTLLLPPGGQTVCAGDALSLSVSAEGFGPLTYQWRRDEVPLPGATDATLVIDPVTEFDAGSYDVIISDDCGDLTSPAAEVIVGTGPDILTSPADQEVCDGSAVSFSVSAAGLAPLTYQWRKDGEAIDGATAPTLEITPVTFSEAGSYDAVVTDVCGQSTSAAAELTVLAGPVIDQQPESQSRCVGDPLLLTVAVTGSGPFDYQWRKDGEALAGETGATFTIDALEPTDAGAYDVVITAGCGEITSAPASISVGTGPVIATPPADTAGCLGSVVVLTVSATGNAPLAYQWRHEDVPIPGATAESLNITLDKAEAAGSYDVVVTDACGTIVSPPATVSIIAATTITQQPAAASACVGAAVTFEVTAVGGTPLSYQWFRDGEPIAGATAAALTLPGVGLADAGAYSASVSGPCGTITSAAATLTVAAGPEITTQPADVEACIGDAPFALAVAISSTEPVSFQWRKDGTSLSGATAAMLVLDPTDASVSGSYDVVVTSACGSVTSLAADVTVSDCTAPPDAPAAPVPADDATEVLLAGDLTWDAPAGATEYDVYFGLTAAPPLVGTTSAPAWPFDGLAEDTDYFWQIVARNSAGATVGPVWRFRTVAPPDDDPGQPQPPPGDDPPPAQDPPDDDPNQPGEDPNEPADDADPPADDPNEPADDPNTPTDDPELPPVMGCGAGLCGAGYIGVLPLLMLTLAGMKRRHRQQAGNNWT